MAEFDRGPRQRAATRRVVFAYHTMNRVDGEVVSVEFRSIARSKTLVVFND